MLAQCCELERYRGFVKKKIIWKKTVAIHNIFKKKITNLNSQTTQY
jgi:hypothetical protein